ncbi:CHAT domain-containing protein [Actinomadura welshii]
MACASSTPRQEVLPISRSSSLCRRHQRPWSVQLEAGVPGIIASLWAVKEMPTFLVTARFYELWLDKGLPPPHALQQAQIWLRNSTIRDFDTYLRANGHNGWPWRYSSGSAEHELNQRVYQEPDHWAAFVYTGI